MLIDDTLIKEAVDLFEECFDKKEQAAAINKVVASELKSWAENKNIDPRNLKAVFGQFVALKTGKLKWGEESDEENDYQSLLISILDSAAGIER